MVAMIHGGLDRLALALADRVSHQPLSWVDPPAEADLDQPLGGKLTAPRVLQVAWPEGPAELDVVAPTDFLPAPNDRFKLRFWPATAARRGAVVLVPPWKLGSFTGFMPAVRALRGQGFDVVGYPTPYHFERTPPGSFSGELFITFDMPRSGWAVRAACLELGAVVESLKPRGPVVLLGTSLGGYLAAMSQVVALKFPERGLAADRMVLVVPPGSILDSFLHTAIGTRYTALLQRSGGVLPDRAVMETLARPFTPANFPSAVTGERALVLAARHDHMVPLRSSQTLALALGARFKAYEAGHVSALLASLELWRDVRDFLLELPAAAEGAAAGQGGLTCTSRR